MKKILNLRGKTAVFIDWANVHGWQKSLKRKIDLKKLFACLKSYKEIKDIRFYFGSDDNDGSRKFMKLAEKTGYLVTTKPVKYVLVDKINGQKIFRRKCDFDIEICIDVHQAMADSFQSFIFFSGDGDFEPLYKLLIKKKKQVVVIYAPEHLGREIWELKSGIYKTEIKLFDVFQKMSP